jgi:hypothetical protein
LSRPQIIHATTNGGNRLFASAENAAWMMAIIRCGPDKPSLNQKERKFTMKKTVTLLIMLILAVVFLTGCQESVATKYMNAQALIA